LALLIYIHPNPSDPGCPCFEDSVACLAAVAGVVVGSWDYLDYLKSNAMLETQELPARKRVLDGLVGGGMEEGFGASSSLWLGLVYAFMKMIVGVGVIYVYRKVTKTVLLGLLEPWEGYVFDQKWEFLVKLKEMKEKEKEKKKKNKKSDGDSKEKDGVKQVPKEAEVDDLNKDIDNGKQQNKHDTHFKDNINTDVKNTATNYSCCTAHDTTPLHRIPRFSVKIVTDTVIYFGIGILAVDYIPRLFKVIGI
jgi:hypothetical protein